MKLHTVFITYNRLELTKIAVESYLATVDVPYSYWIVDNGSSDGTDEWLIRERHPATLLGRNFYPGFACNRGWEWAPEDATHLQRADNDMEFLPRWCQQVEIGFRGRRVGQVGLRTQREENACRTNTGGNCVILRELWDKGLRYDERPWQSFPAGCSEDTYFSPAVQAMGYKWKRVSRSCLRNHGPSDLRDPEAWADPYYQRSFGDRRISRPR